MNREQLINSATAKNFQIEYSKDKYDNELIGINKGKHVYHWFKIYSDDCVLFHHSYSQNTGRINRGVIHGLRVERSLLNNVNA